MSGQAVGDGVHISLAVHVRAVEDDDGRPSLRVALLVALGGADAVGQQSLGGPVDDLAGRERDVAAELRRPAALPAVPRIGPVVDGRALERLAVLAEVEPALAVAEPDGNGSRAGGR